MEDDELSSGIQMANAYAVIIGIGKYKDPTIPTLKYTWHAPTKDTTSYVRVKDSLASGTGGR